MIVKKRIEFIDLMKGFCILSVVLGHISPIFKEGIIGIAFTSFRMPLYFFLSGLFFKSYSGIKEFSIKKINNLIVPFFFFYVSAYLLAYFKSDILGLYEKGMLQEKFHWIYLLDFMINSTNMRYNTPIWFLISLFEISIMYYILSMFFSFKTKTIVIIALSLAVWILSYYEYSLPFFISASIVALPIFHLGTIVKRTSLLENIPQDRYLIWLTIPVSLLVVLFATPIDLAKNIFAQNYLLFYLVASGGIFVIFMISKKLKHLPLISYYGRYSLIILGTHGIIFSPLKSIFLKFMPDELFTYLLIFLVTMALELIAIPICVKVFPQFTAQKELIKTKRFYS